jgi:hypothetical protein
LLAAELLVLQIDGVVELRVGAFVGAIKVSLASTVQLSDGSVNVGGKLADAARLDHCGSGGERAHFILAINVLLYLILQQIDLSLHIRIPNLKLRTNTIFVG